MLVFVASAEALQSVHVRSEVELFVDKRHVRNKGIFQCINFGAFQQTKWVQEKNIDTISFISEDATFIREEKASPQVIDFISDSFLYNKSNYQLRRAAGITGVILLTMILGSIYLTRQLIGRTKALALQSDKLDSLQIAETKSREAGEKLGRDLALSRQSLDSSNTARRQALEMLSITTDSLSYTKHTLHQSAIALLETNTKLGISASSLKEEAKRSSLEQTRNLFGSGEYGASYMLAKEALTHNRRLAQGALSDYCDTNSVTPTDLGLLFMASLADNFREYRYDSRQNIEEIKAFTTWDNGVLALTDDNLSVARKNVYGWEDEALDNPVSTQTELITVLPDRKGFIIIESKPSYDASDDQYIIRYYRSRDGKTMLTDQDTLIQPYKNWQPRFGISVNEQTHQLVIYSTPLYKGNEAIQDLTIHLYDISDSRLTHVSDFKTSVPDKLALKTIEFTLNDRLNVYLQSDTSLYRQLIDLQKGIVSAITPLFNGYHVWDTYIKDKKMTALLGAGDTYYLADYTDTVENWKAPFTLENVPEEHFTEGKIIYAAGDSVVIAVSQKDDINLYHILLKKLPESFRQIAFQTTAKSDNIIYDPYTSAFIFSRGNDLFYRSLSSNLEFLAGHSSGGITDLKCDQNGIYAFYSCQTDAEVPCINFASWNKPLLQQHPEQTSSQIGYSNNEAGSCVNANKLFAFFIGVDDDMSNNAVFFENEEAYNNMGETHPNPNPDDWARYSKSPDGRWALVLINGELEVVDLVEQRNMHFDIKLPGIHLEEAQGYYFSGDGKYFFLDFGSFSYRLNMPGLVSSEL